MQETDLLRLTWIADPRISPDGTRIAFTRVTIDAKEDAYRTGLWIAPVAGGAPRALTFGQSDTSPRWSPDGRRLAFLRPVEKGKPPQLWVLPMEGGGEAVRLTDLPKGAGGAAWSPDGRTIAFTSATNSALDSPEAEANKPKNEPARIVARPQVKLDNAGFLDPSHNDHVWVVPADGSAPPRQLTTGRFSEAAPQWSPDGARVLFLSDRRLEPWFGPEDSDVWSVDAARTEPTEEVELVADAAGPIQAFRVGADGRIAACGASVTDPPRTYDQPDVWLFEPPFPVRTARVLSGPYDSEAGSSTVSSDVHPPRGGGEVPLAFTEGGRAVLGVVTRHGACMLARFGIDDGAVTEWTSPDQEVIAGSVTPDGRFAALVVGDVAHPGRLAVFDVAARALRVLHDPNEALLAEAKLGEVEELWYDSFDGRRIQGWIVKPPGFDPAKKYPLILEIHGGPHVAYGVGFFHEFRVLAAAGYVVLYTNPRGSTSYGQEFGNVIQYRYPGDDWKDLMAGVDVLLARGYVDAERMGVTGGSGGGLLTNWTVTHTDRFRAAITQRCVTDWASFWYGADFPMFTSFWFRRPPFEDLSEYQERSPISFIGNAKTPLLVIHSEEDWRTPLVQGEAMFRAYLRQRLPVAMARFPGEGHELSRSGAPSRRVQNQVLIRRWFDRWLLGKEAPEFDDPLAAPRA